jgi:hypothetical protein
VSFIAAMLAIAVVPAAMSAECAPTIAAGELSAQKFKLSYVTLNKHESVTGEDAAVDAFYFANASCECGFPAPEGVTFGKNEVAAAASGRRGLSKLAVRLADVSGTCPMAMTNSPYFHCFGDVSKPCKGENQ